MNNDIIDTTTLMTVSPQAAALYTDVGRIEFDDQPTSAVSVKGSKRGYINWGESNDIPTAVVSKIESNEVMSANMDFNVTAAYGRGLSYSSKDNKEIKDEEILRFFKRNRPTILLPEQFSDLKHWRFAVSVFIVDAAGDKIVQCVAKEAMHCRFESCNAQGVIENVLFANWSNTDSAKSPEVISLLNPKDPWGDLMMRLGKIPNKLGKTEKTKCRKFAYLIKLPGPGRKYYPFAPYQSLFKNKWYDISQSIPAAKLNLLNNGMKIKYHITVHQKYWDALFKEENISGLKEKQERKKKLYEEINKYLTGVENGNKSFSSSRFDSIDGKPIDSIEIKVIDTKKEGGDWLQDSEEASNMICYAMGVHPSLNGATPGKSKGALSGSNIREIFTMKQSLEKLPRDLIIEQYKLIADVNNWDIRFEIKDIMLTTLDKGTDAKEVSQYKS